MSTAANSKLIFSMVFVVACFSVAGLFGWGHNAEKARLDSTDQPVRALIDASKDPVYWWVQVEPPAYDANGGIVQTARSGFSYPYYGKSMADSMREKGWKVRELKLGENLDADTLKNFDIIVRTPPLLPYTEMEANAYRQAVASGARLLLMASAGGDDVARGFGIRFGDIRQVRLNKIIPNEFMQAMARLPIPWIEITEMPQDAVALAWETGGNPLLGFRRYTEGYVLFYGAPLGIDDDGPQLQDDLLNFLAKPASESLESEMSATPKPIDGLKAALPPPALITPRNGDTLSQPYMDSWSFEWDDVPGAAKYQIIVQGWGVGNPVINTKIGQSKIVMPQQKDTYTENNRIGWTWRVRAQDQKGKWGSWSEKRLFFVAPLPLQSQK